MPGIEWVSTLDNSSFVKSLRQMQDSVRHTSDILKSVGDSFDIDNVISQINALTKVLQSNEEAIALSKKKIKEWNDEAMAARDAGDFITFDKRQIDISKELENIEIANKDLEDTRRAINDIFGLWNNLNGQKAPMLFDSQDEYDKVQRLKAQIADLQAQIASFDGSEDELEGLRGQLTWLTDDLRDCETKAAMNASSLGNAGSVAAEAATRYYELTNAVKKQSEKVAELEVKLRNAKEEMEKANSSGNIQAISDARNKYDAFAAAVDNAKQSLINMQTEQHEFHDKMLKLSDTTSKAGSEIISVFKNIAAVAGISFGLNEAKNFIGKVVEMRSYFQDIESSMKVFLGSAEKGAEFTKKLKDYAYYNMFEFKDLAAASQQMIAYGHDVDTIIGRIDQLSNVAVGTHGSLLELVDAYNRAKSTGVVDARGIQSWAVKGVMIRDTLKEMGEQAVGTTITFEQLNKVLDRVTGEGGMFHDLQLSMMENISAEIGQFQDNFDSMLNEIGEKYQGVITGVIKFGSELIDNYKKIGSVIMDAIAAYGAYRVALITTLALEKLTVASRAAAILHTNTLSVAVRMLAKETGILNALMSANPYVLVGAAVGALAFGIYKLATREDEEAAARRRANEQMDDFKKKLDDQKNRINQYLSVLRDSTATEYEKALAWEHLSKEAPSLTEKYTQQQMAAKDLSEAEKEVKETMEDLEFDGYAKQMDTARESIKKAQEEIEKYEERIKELENKGTRSEEESNELIVAKTAISALKKSIIGYEETLHAAEEAYNKIKELRDKAKEEEKPIEIRIKEASDNVKVKESVLQFYKEAVNAVEYFQDANNSLNYKQGLESLDEFIKTSQAELDDLREKIKKNPLDVGLSMEYKEKQKILDQVIDMRNNIQSGGFNIIPIILSFKADYQGLVNIWNTAKQKLQSLFGQTVNGGAPSLQQEYNTAKTRFGNAKKKLREIDANRAKYTREERIAAENELKTAKEAFSALGGDVSESRRTGSGRGGGSGKNPAEAAAKERQRLFDLERTEKERIAQERQKTEDAIEDAIIANIDKNAERERREREIQHTRSIRQIEEQADKFRQEAFKRAEDEFNATNKDKTKVFSDTEVGKAGWEAMELSETQQTYIQAQLDKENAEYKRYLEERKKQDREQLYSYIKEYGGMQDRKAAIAKQYDEQIAETSNIIEKASLEEKKRQELKAIDMEALKSDIDWETVFNNMDRVSTNALKNLRDKLREALRDGSLDPDNAKVLSEKLLEAENEIASRSNIYANMIPALQERVRLTNAARVAEEELANATARAAENEEAYRNQQENILATLEGFAIGDDGSTIDTSSLRSDQITADMMDEIVRMFGIDEGSDAFNRLKEEFDKLAIASDALGKSQDEATESMKRASDANKLLEGFKGEGFMGGINDIFSEAVENAGGGVMGTISVVNSNLQSLPELIDTIGLSNTEFGEAVGNFAEGTSSFVGAIQSFASGDFVGGITGIIKGFQSYGRIFGIGGGNAAETNRELARLSEKNEILTDAIDRLNDTMGKQSGSNAIKTYEEMVKLQRELEENLREQIRLQMGYHSAHHSFEHEWGGVSSGDLEQFNRLHNTSWNGDLSSLTAEEAAAIMSDVNLRELIKGTGKGGYGERVLEWISQLAEQAGKTKEATDALYASLTAGTTRESVYSDFLNDLYDLANGSEDVMDNIAKNWQQMVNKMVINNLIGSKMQKELEAWYEALGKLNEERSKAGSAMTDDEYFSRLEELQKRYEGFVTTAQGEIDDLTKMGIIKPVDDAASTALMTLDTIRDGWRNMLMDMSQSTDDWANDIARIMAQALIEDEILNAQWKEQQEEWLARYKEAMEDQSLTDAQRQALLRGLQEEQEDWIESNRTRARQIMEMTGYDADGRSEQSATVQAMERITVDQADELIGRMNAGQIIWEQQRALTQQIQQNMQSMYELVNGSVGRGVNDLVSLAVTRNQHLTNILTACQTIHADMTSEMEDMKRIMNEKL